MPAHVVCEAEPWGSVLTLCSAWPRTLTPPAVLQSLSHLIPSTFCIYSETQAEGCMEPWLFRPRGKKGQRPEESDQHKLPKQ